MVGIHPPFLPGYTLPYTTLLQYTSLVHRPCTLQALEHGVVELTVSDRRVTVVHTPLTRFTVGHYSRSSAQSPCFSQRLEERGRHVAQSTLLSSFPFHCWSMLHFCLFSPVHGPRAAASHPGDNSRFTVGFLRNVGYSRVSRMWVSSWF